MGTKQIDAIGHCHSNDGKVVVITKASYFKVLLIEKETVVGSILNGSNPMKHGNHVEGLVVGMLAIVNEAQR